MWSGVIIVIMINFLVTQVLTLDKCIEIALEQNLTLKQLKEELRAATAEYRSSWSNFLPNLSLSGGYSRSRSENPWPGGYYTYEDTAYSASLHLTQTLFDSDQLALSGELRAHREVLEMGYRKERLSTSLKVKQDYYNLLKTRKLLEVSQMRLKEGETNLQKTDQLHKLGSASRADLLKAKVNLLEGRLELTRAKKNVEIAKSNLLITLGMNPSEDIVVKEDFHFEPKEPPPYESLLELAWLHNPELRKAGANFKLAKASLYASYGNYLPKLSMSASYGYEGNHILPVTEAWDTGRKGWRFGLNISLPLFTGFRRFLTVNKAKAELRSAEYYRRMVERNLILEFEECYLGINEAKEMLELAEETLELANESYKAAKERYELGAAPILELIDAELSLVKAESARIQALYDYKLGIERLKTIVGKEDL